MQSKDAIQLAQTLAVDFATRAADADKKGQLPKEDVDALRQSGYLALSVPREFGGQGLRLRDCVAAHVALAEGSAATAMVAGMQIHVFGHEREVHSWRADAYERLCRAAVDGALVNSLASEPQLGSPSRGGLPTTTAVATADGQSWQVNGQKTWSTGGQHLTHMLVRCAVEDKARVILIERTRPGIRWRETWQNALSLRASDSNDVFFEDVIVPRDNLIDKGHEQRQHKGNVWFPMVMSAVYLGTAVAARNSVIQFALERVPTALGRPIATLPKIQRQIGEIDIALQAAQALLLEVASEWQDENTARVKFLARVAAAKTIVTETANKVTEQALQIAGGTSITGTLPLERFFRDVRAGSMQPPSGDTAREMVGRAALAL